MKKDINDLRIATSEERIVPVIADVPVDADYNKICNLYKGVTEYIGRFFPDLTGEQINIITVHTFIELTLQGVPYWTNVVHSTKLYGQASEIIICIIHMTKLPLQGWNAFNQDEINMVKLYFYDELDAKKISAKFSQYSMNEIIQPYLKLLHHFAHIMNGCKRLEPVNSN
jgi:hypothetical protein